MQKSWIALTFLLVFSFSVTLLGNETEQKYFPHTLGSYWVYEDQDGSEVIRRAIKGKEIAGKTYHAFSYKLEDWEAYSPFIYPSLYHVSQAGITLLVGDKIERTVKARLKEETDFFAKLSKALGPPILEVENKVIVEKDHLLLLPDTITTGEAWDITEIVAKIKILYDSIGEMTYNFMIDQKGVVLGIENVNTPAGTFKDCLKVRYYTITTVHAVVGGEPAFLNAEAPGETVTTVWFAPNIGIVKTYQQRQHTFLEIISDDTEDFSIAIPNPQPKTLELKKYEIKKVDQD